MPSEIARFDALARQWWDPRGPMRVLHRMNPARIGWIETRLRPRFGGLAGVRVLDVGCGGGLASEAFSRRGAVVTGIDAAGEAIAAAARHASGMANAPTYRVATVEVLADEGTRFQAVTALEVIEHVPDPAAFVAGLARLLEPGGVLALSTLNRTPLSFATAKLGAEYLLRMLPVGTHEWRRFVTPSELSGWLREAGLRPLASAGLSYRPMTGAWTVSRDLGINYLMAASA